MPETLVAGTTYFLYWVCNPRGSLKLEYSTDGGATWIIITCNLNAGLNFYAWHVPPANSSNCLIRITDMQHPGVCAITPNPFTIETHPSVSVLSPRGGQRWTENEKHNITWEQSYCTNVKIQYSINNGESYTTIISQTPADDLSYEWTIPNTFSSRCLVKILCYEDQEYFDISHHTFSILKYVVPTSLTFSDSHTFLDHECGSLDILFFTPLSFICAYTSEYIYGYPYLFHGIISQNNVVRYNRFSPRSERTEILDLYKLSSTKFALLANTGNDSSTYALRAIIGNREHTTLTFGEWSSKRDYNVSNYSGCKISGLRAVMAFRDPNSGDVGNARIWNVQDITPYSGPAYTFNYGSTYNTHCSRQNDYYFIISFRDNSNSDYGTLVRAYSTSDAISYGSKFVFNSAFTDNIACEFFSDNQFIIAYRHGGYGNYGRLKIGTIDGPNITFSSSTTFNAANTFDIDVKKIDSTTLLVSYNDNNTLGKIKIITISGSSISLSDFFTFTNGSSLYAKIAIQNSTHFLIAYRDPTYRKKGVVKIGREA